MQRNRSVFVITTLFIVGGALLPSLALADASAVAGISPGSLWLSKASVTEGNSVKIMMPVYDSDAVTVAGDAVFSVDGADVGTAHFQLNSGEAEIVSTQWKAVVGQHAISARIENTTNADAKQAVMLTGVSAGPISVDVAAAPPPPTAIKLIEDAASVATPAVLAASQALVNEAENLRQSAVAALSNAVANGDGQGSGEKATGLVLGAETYKTPSNVLPAAAAASKGASGWMLILDKILLFIVSSAWIFYPLGLILMLLILFFVLKRVAGRRPTQTA